MDTIAASQASVSRTVWKIPWMTVPNNRPYNVVHSYTDCVELLRLFRKITYFGPDYNLDRVKTSYDVLVYKE